MTKLKLYYIVLLLMILAQCASPKQNTSKDFETGKVIDTVKCTIDKNQSYSLYLPSGYSPENTYPLIVAFDPDGDGTKPIELYNEIAESENYIIAGSHNCENGLPWTTIKFSVDILLSDLQVRLSVDTQRIYTAGFSGGGRIASSVALTRRGIAGAISCGAGITEKLSPELSNFIYVGVVGNTDFNYLEIINLDRFLNQSKFNNRLHIFEGGHQWPPIETFHDIITDLKFYEMRLTNRVKNSILINKNIKTQERHIKKQLKANDQISALNYCNQTIKNLTELSNINYFSKKQQEILQSENFAKQIKLTKKTEQTEISLRSIYGKALQNKDYKWWQKEISKLHTQANAATNKTEQQMTKRILSFLGIVFHINIEQLINIKSFDKAKELLKLKTQVKPDEGVTQFLYACYYAQQNDTSAAITALKQSIKLGYNNIEKIKNETTLKSLKNDSDFISIINKHNE